MKKLCKTLLVCALLTLAGGTLIADEESAQQLRSEAALAESQAMLREAEKAREEAVMARQEASKAARAAREISRKHAQAAREEALRANSNAKALEKAAEREEITRAREELSRAHRELREASREVAQAHRDLSHSAHETSGINLGDRAVIGVVLGKQTEEGVELIGISPDGPAERAGLQPGDVLVSIRGEDLSGKERSRQSVFQVMRDVGDGEELAVVVNRAGQPHEYTVTAEQREPRGWQSVVRIEEFMKDPENPQAPHVIVETIEIPEIDEVALAAEIAELSERIEATNHMFVIHDGENVRELEIEGFSDFGSHAMSEANIWFGLPQAHGLELTAVNEGLGAYFKTDRGVLVIKAREGNAYELASGDVILSIDSIDVNSPSDMMRALRDVDPGGEVVIRIKRDRKDRTLNVIVPENRLGHRTGPAHP